MGRRATKATRGIVARTSTAETFLQAQQDLCRKLILARVGICDALGGNLLLNGEDSGDSRVFRPDRSGIILPVIVLGIGIILALSMAHFASVLYLAAGLLCVYLAFTMHEILRTRVVITEGEIELMHLRHQRIAWQDVQETDVFGTGLGRFTASVDGVVIRGVSPNGRKVRVAVAYKLFSPEDQKQIVRLIDAKLRQHGRKTGR